MSKASSHQVLCGYSPQQRKLSYRSHNHTQKEGAHSKRTTDKPHQLHISLVHLKHHPLKQIKRGSSFIIKRLKKLTYIFNISLNLVYIIISLNPHEHSNNNTFTKHSRASTTVHTATPTTSPKSKYHRQPKGHISQYTNNSFTNLTSNTSITTLTSTHTSRFGLFFPS